MQRFSRNCVSASCSALNSVGRFLPFSLSTEKPQLALRREGSLFAARLRFLRLRQSAGSCVGPCWRPVAMRKSGVCWALWWPLNSAP